MPGSLRTIAGLEDLSAQGMGNVFLMQGMQWCSRLVLMASLLQGLSLAQEDQKTPPSDTFRADSPATNSVVNDQDNNSSKSPDAAGNSNAVAKSAKSVAIPPSRKTPPVFPGPKNLPPTGPYKPMYFDNDFSTQSQPDAKHILGEELKLMKLEFLDIDFVFSTGGEIRHRYMQQTNRLQPGGPGRDTYNLSRWRHYFDMKAGNNFRLYVEGIDAGSFGEELPAQAIDENRWDLQNAFIDIVLFDTESGGSHTLRAGRQELSFGRQRLVSPLDWANTRRNFEGFRYMVKEKDYKFDLFTVNPVNAATGFNALAEFDNKFDQPNYDVFFSGAYFTCTALENTNVDIYYLWLEDNIQVPVRADGRRHTVGARYARLLPRVNGRVWDLDIEGGYQFGEDNDQQVQAGFATAGLGHSWKNATWSPRLSGLFFYGSGDARPTDNENNTFYTMFPLGHAYWGISDNLAGQNLLDYAIQVDLQPADKIGLTSAYHYFQLASNGDRIYNVAGVPIGTPGNGTDLGQALDLYGYYAFNPNLDIQAGYSWFWYGSFIDRTTPREDASQFYIQTSFRY